MARIGSREARLTLRLVDAVTRPARAVMASLTGLNTQLAGVASSAMAPARAVSQTARRFRSSARDMTVGSAGMAYAAFRGGKVIYDMEDTLNEIEGRRFGKNQTFALANGVEMNRLQFRESVANLVEEINETVPRTADEIFKAYNQLVQAGLSHEQVHAILPTSIDFAIAGNYDTEESADKLTNVMTSMRLPMATMDEAQASALRAADVIAYAANSTNSDVRQMTEAFKYAAPSASALGVSIEQLAGMFLIQARRGIKASESGVSIRAMFTRMVRPTNMAASALERYGLDLADYLEKSDDITGRNVADALGFGGLDASVAVGEIDEILQKSISTGDKVREISAAVMKAVGDESTMSAQAVSEVIRETLFGFGENLDVERLIADMQAAGIAMSDFFRIFDVRQGARTIALFGDDLSARVQDIVDNADGFAEALKNTRMQGIVGSIARMVAALIQTLRAIADSGVLDKAAQMFEWLGRSLTNLRSANPRLLELGTYAILAAGALAPLGFILSGITAALAIMLNPLTWIVGGLVTLAGIHFGPLTWFLRALSNIFTHNLKPEILEGVGSALDSIRAGFRGLADFGSDGEAWARTAKVWGESMATAVNAVYDVVTRLVGTQFVQSYAEGFTNAFRNMAAAARWLADSMQSLGVNMQPLIDLLDTDFASGLGTLMGTMTGYGVAFALAAAGIAIVAWPIRRVASALALLSGVKLAWPLLRFLGGLALLATKAAAIAALGGALRGLGRGATAAAGAGAAAGAADDSKRSGGRGAAAARGAAPAATGLPRPAPLMDLRPMQYGLRNIGSFLKGGALAAIANFAGEEGIKGGFRLFGVEPAELPSLADNLRTIREEMAGIWSEGAERNQADIDEQLRLADVRARIDTLRGDLLDATEGWSQAATRSIVDYVAALANGGDDAQAEANRIGQKIVEELTVTGNPDVDTGRLERALGIARELSSAIRSINGGGGASAPASSPRRFGGARRKGGPVKRGLTYLVGEEGEELFEPDQDGHITSNRDLRRGRPGAGGGSRGAGGGLTIAGPLIGTMTIQGGNAKEVMREIQRELESALTRSWQVALDGRSDG